MDLEMVVNTILNTPRVTRQDDDNWVGHGLLSGCCDRIKCP